MNTPIATSWNHRLTRLDVVGSALSTLCAIHCLAMPLVAGLLPVLGLGFLGDRAFDRAACVAMMALAAVCLAWGCRVHHRWWLFGLLGCGAALTLGTQFVLAPETCAKSCCAGAVNWSQALVMFTGGGAIAVAHVLNLRFRRACRYCAEASTPLVVSGAVRARTLHETPSSRTGLSIESPCAN